MKKSLLVRHLFSFIKNKKKESISNPRTGWDEFDDFLPTPKVQRRETLDITFDYSEIKKGKYLVFDIETTGLPKYRDASPKDIKNWPYIVQIGWILFDEYGKMLEHKEYILKQRKNIPQTAIEIHGITNEIAKEKGIDLVIAYSEFMKALSNSEILVCHNMEFDFPIVTCEFIRNGLDPKLLSKKKICTMKVGTKFCKIPRYSGGYKYPTLSELFKTCFYADAASISIKEKHQALIDAGITAKCFFKLKELNVIKD